MSMRGAERGGGDTESEAGSRLTEPDAGLKLADHEIVTWAEVGRLTDWATQASLFKIFLTFIYFWDRERQSTNGGGSEREGDTESETGSRLWAVSTEPDAGLELTDREITTWAKVGHLTDWATQAPQEWTFYVSSFISFILK